MKTNSDSISVDLNKFASPRVIALCLLAAVLVLMLLGVTGCKGADRADHGVANIAGDYTLVSVDGKAVPCVVSHEGRDLTVKSGVFTINTNGTCRSQSVFAVSGYGDTKRVVDADYTVSGTELTMRWKGAGTTTGNVTGDTFTMDNEGMIFAYQK